ncbi:hypothetical protein [Psychroflexus salis]|uniref:Uncharacterized protein n=1 Tax=Psychroflexus salis TaxID=1526574 RepID=A0A916ZL38_9FLAO|nr:hypothetical protein [Psychroflexus salis]GGE02820.1 hypothetical protein GCM10010831_00720 [Psychroflexus salis]
MKLQHFRNTTFTKLFWGFIGLYFLNIGVDTSDINSNLIPEDLSLNEQESIVEIIVEKVFNYGNVIKEQDDEDTEDYSKKRVSKIDLSPLKNEFNEDVLIIFLTFKNNFNSCKSSLSEAHYYLEKPPPKV